MAVIEEQNPMASFLYALKAPESRRQYPRRFKMFLDFVNIQGTLEEQAKQFVIQAREEQKWAQDNIMRFLEFHKERVRRKEIAPGTVINYYRATKLFCEMNDLAITWKKIARGLPKPKNSANDRAPTMEELRKLTEYPDRRIKPIVYAMTSGGFRLGAWDYLRWKHVIPKSNDRGDVIAAKVVIYAEEGDEYYTFITPEAYNALKDWIDLPACHYSVPCSHYCCFQGSDDDTWHSSTARMCGQDTRRVESE
ncbi:MAG: hypothetical protein WAZ77_04085, partial [Candidatus Nitrosopolaris sp.]